MNCPRSMKCCRNWPSGQPGVNDRCGPAVDRPQPGHWGDLHLPQLPRDLLANDRTLLQSFADQAAVAVSNAQLYTQSIQEKQKMSALLDSVADGILILKPNHVIERVNPAFARMMGISMDSLVARTMMRSSALPIPNTVPPWKKPKPAAGRCPRRPPCTSRATCCARMVRPSRWG